MPTPEDRITRFARLVRTGRVERGEGALRAGVDLGTANIVMSVVDAAGHPVAGAMQHSAVVRDGIVVDWRGAVETVTRLRQELDERLGAPLTEAAVAVPPAISQGTIKVFTNVLEAAGLQTREVVDEPVAAARALGLSDAAVIDIGHGTTGVSIIADGQAVLSADEASGGHHMTLVIAGSCGLDYDRAEQLKQDPDRHDLVLGLVRPTLEKMALIAAGVLGEHQVPAVYLVGGSSSHPRAAQIFAEVLRREVIRPDEPLFVTPLGIAMPSSLGASDE